MKKGKLLKRIAVAAGLAAIVGLSATVGTMAAYRSTKSYEISGTTGAWTIGFSNPGTFKATQTLNFNTAKVVPGTSGTYTITVNNTGDANATVTITEGTWTKPTNMTVSWDKKSANVNHTNGTATFTLTWSWPYNASGDDTNDAGKAIGCTITVNTVQVQPTAPAVD